MSTITSNTPIIDHILVTNMNFSEQTTASGLYIPSDNGKSEGVKPRWCKIYAIGPLQTDVKVGEWLLVEHGRWTRGIEVQVDAGTKIEVFRIDPNGILLVADHRSSDIELGSFTTPTAPGLADYAKMTSI